MRISKEELDQRRKQAGIPGLSVRYVDLRHPERSSHIEQGVSDVKSTAQVTEKTRFGAASLSKPVAALIFLKALSKGLFRTEDEANITDPKILLQKGLDRPLYEIADFGPEHIRQDPRYKLLTARILLSHKSGFPIKGDPADLYFMFNPGDGYGYSGFGYVFLQEIFKEKTGKSFEDLAQELFHDPECLMPNSTFVPVQQPVCAANSLFTTTEDYTRFITYWMSEDQKIFHEAFINQVDMTKIRWDEWPKGERLPDEILEKVGWGLGWGLQLSTEGAEPKVTRLYHSGDMNQWRAWAVVNVEDKTMVVYFANSPEGHRLADYIVSSTVGLDDGLEFFFGTYAFQREVQPVANAPPMMRDQYSGTGKQPFFSQPRPSATAAEPPQKPSDEKKREREDKPDEKMGGETQDPDPRVTKKSSK